MEGKLFVVATPIGNLSDITYRALEILREVDFILCEDTRVTQKILFHFSLQKPLVTFHEHSGEEVFEKVLSELGAGKKIALVTDAGTPGISDPGGKLIERIYEEFSQAIVPVPGPSAVIAALSISGFPTDKFIFMGFPPQKNKRQKYFDEVATANHTVVFYESSHRIIKCLEDMSRVLEPDREVMVCRELTKKFESVYRGKMSEIMQAKISEKGEFVIIVRRPRT